MQLTIKYIILSCICIVCLQKTALHAQQVDLENALGNFRKKFEQSKKLKINGGITASTTWSQSTVGGTRDPFIYSVGGNLNFSFLSVTIPVSLNFTNAGFSYSYQYPRLPNRLSIHPKYKSWQAHIGDFSMNFSPYTISGFQLVGAGLDFKPGKKWQYSAFYGRLQKAVPYVENNGNTLAAYKRTGAGIKVALNDNKMQGAISMIRIQDIKNSLAANPPDSVHVFPKANYAVSLEGRYKLTRSLQLEAQTGISFLTNDVRAQKDSGAIFPNNIIGLFTPVNASTNIYKAVKANITYTIGSSNAGIGYERIDPGYQTLGAYYFTNDLENITFNFAQQLFNNKVNLGMNLGLQKDDLKNEKTGRNKRVVSAINASINASKKLTAGISYSNFQSFTNIKPQFQYINQLTSYSNLDTLNFKQLNQSANVNVNYIMRSDKDKSNMLNVNLSFQDSYDEQGGIISKGNASQFYNLAANYTSAIIPKNFNFSAGFNATYNTIGTNNIITAGPTILAGRQFFDKKLRTNFSLSYNISMQQIVMQKVIAARATAGYVYKKKHQFNMNGLFMHRVIKGVSGKDFSATFSYAWSF
jgi:hypothetical protein